MRRRATAVVALMAIGVCALPGAADEPGRWREGWHFQLSPYVWMAGLEGDIATLSGLPQVEVDASFSDLIEETDLTFMLQAEVRYRRIGFLTDLGYLDLSLEEDTPGPLFSGVDLDTTTFFATLGPFYRAVESERGALDLFAGLRLWKVDTELDFQPGVLAGRRTHEDEVWVDPLLGARASVKLLGPLFLAGGADVGGFGAASDVTWQAIGTLDVQPWQWLVLRAGYRHLAADYHHGGFVWDVTLSGPIIGAALRF